MEYKNQHFEGERALFKIKDSTILNCLFDNGESPLKESRNLVIKDTTFGYKYPMWYSAFLDVSNCNFLEMSRSGIWYTNDSTFTNLNIIAPKEFRRCNNIKLDKIIFHNASETLWWCSNVNVSNTQANGDYFMMNSTDVKVDHLTLNGNYFLDGGKNIIVTNSVLNSKDAFWNCKNVLVENCIINGEYLAWNAKNITFKNCKIISHQGLCYIQGLVMENCTLIDSDLTFEYCSDINADIKSVIDSIKNPISGKIKCYGIKELIREEDSLDFSKTEILIKKGENYEKI